MISLLPAARNIAVALTFSLAMAMYHELDNVRSGESKRLVINIPPRCLKSVTVAVAHAMCRWAA